MAAAGKKSTKKKKGSRKRTPIFGVRLLLWLSAFTLTFAGLAAILLLPHKEPLTTAQSDQATYRSSADSESASGKMPPSQEQKKIPKPFIYEEKVGTDFDLRVWEADMAILQTLSLMDHGEDRMQHKNIETKFFYGTPYHFQEIVIYTQNKRDEFISKLGQTLDRFLSNATLTSQQHQNTWALKINGQTTHIINLKKLLQQPLPGTGRIVIIIDDLGETLEYAENLSRLDFPVIFSILPYLAHTEKVVKFAEENQIETMLHLPMEPNTFSRGVNPGKGALLVNMGSDEIKKRVADNLRQVPGAIGVNNHMGSRFTQDAERIAVVFDELKKHGLFFLDSLTTPESVAEDMARQKGLDFLKRHIFLDNVQDKKAILFQLSKAENIAIKHGLAVAIGHPYPETLSALREWKHLKSDNVEVVNISELVSTMRYRTAARKKMESLP
ncbi:MAG: divergent polysaccharide deacetylase family protein [Desulfonatronovibrio sp.]